MVEGIQSQPLVHRREEGREEGPHLEPNDHEVQPTHNAQLTCGQTLQRALGVLDRDDVDVVQEDLHAEERDGEAGKVR